MKRDRFEESEILRGKYEYVKELGEGQFGYVNLYRDVTNNQMVAIKVLEPKFEVWKHAGEYEDVSDDLAMSLAQEEAKNGFTAECESLTELANLNFPFPILYDCWEVDTEEHGTVYYIAMQFLHGPTLANIGSKREYETWKEENKIDVVIPQDALNKFVRDVNFMYSLSVYNNDMTADNVMWDTETQRFYVIDWGFSGHTGPDELRTFKWNNAKKKYVRDTKEFTPDELLVYFDRTPDFNHHLLYLYRGTREDSPIKAMFKHALQLDGMEIKTPILFGTNIACTVCGVNVTHSLIKQCGNECGTIYCKTECAALDWKRNGHWKKCHK